MAELGEGLLVVGLLGLDEVFFLTTWLLSLTGKHGPLGIYDLSDGALHEDDAVAVLGW